MHRRSFAWAAFAVGLLALIGAPRIGVAPIYETGAVEVESASSGVPYPDLLEVASSASRAAIEPAISVLAAAATEPPPAPDSAAAPVQPEQVAASPAEAAPVARVVVAARALPEAATCPVNPFCYPRVGIAGLLRRCGVQALIPDHRDERQTCDGERKPSG